MEVNTQSRFQFELEVKNYRCFPDSKPLRLTMTPGFTSFVGVNNAGKSSILRFFWEFAPLFRHLSQPTGNLLTAIVDHDSAVKPFQLAQGEDAFSKMNSRDITIRIRLDSPSLKGGESLERQDLKITILRSVAGYQLRGQIDGAPLETGSSVSELSFRDTTLERLERPIINLRPFFEVCAILGKAMYLGPFRNTINVGSQINYFDISVGDAFIQVFHNYKAGPEPDANEAIHRMTQDIKRIFGFSELDINADSERRMMQVLVDGRSFRLPELGTGLAQFILVMANVLVKQPSLVLIDEPEASLHPTLQLDFLTSLASYTQTGSVMFATHNLGLARAAAERIYSCKRLELGMTEVLPFESTPHLGEFMGALGFSAYRDLGFNSVLLVEGPSDVKTFQQLLRMRGKEHSVVLLPLGGDSMINESAEVELAEVTRISPAVAAIIDSERGDSETSLPRPRVGFKGICEKLGIRLLILERRAIENYFPDRAIKDALGSGFSALDPYQPLNDARPGWRKRENWRIARHMKKEDLEGTDVGNFIDGL